jgi:putative ABC transport system permease protein
LEALCSDLGYAARRLARRPGLTLVAVATLALGIGGATAIFSLADAVILRPLPYANPDRLVMLWQADSARHQSFLEMSYPAYAYWRDHNQSFEHLAGMTTINWGWKYMVDGLPVEIAGRPVSASFFLAMGVPPLLGRGLQDEDDRIGADPVVVLSHDLWRARFSEDPAVVGRSIVLNDRACTVVGVMPEGFAFPQGAQLWIPLVPAAGATDVESGGVMWMVALGRLKPAVSVEKARMEMSGLLVRYLRGIVDRYERETKNRFEYFIPETFSAVTTPLSDTIFGATRPALLALLGTVLMVLLIACANVAGLLLIQATERSREMATRLALGASPGGLARGLFAESLLLALAGGALGLFTAAAGIPLLVRLSPEDVPRLGHAAIDGRVLGFALVALVTTAVLAGLAPMLLVRKTSVEAMLREGSRRMSAGRSRLRATLVVCEVAAALVLLVGAGLLARSFVELRRVPLGFQPARVLSVDAYAPERYSSPEQWRPYYQELLRRVESLPGVESAGTVSQRPLVGTAGWDYPFTIEGQSDAAARLNPVSNLAAVSADYFRTMGIAVKAGRVFTDADSDGRPGVVIVSEALARYAWPGRDPLGKRLSLPQMGQSRYHGASMEVIGVVADSRSRELQATRLDLYLSYLQADHKTGHLMVKARGDVVTVAAAVRDSVWRMDTEQVPPTVIAMSNVVSEALGGARFAARVFAAFALVALLLSSLGLYGLLTYSVTGRTREIGVRLALGALPRDVVHLVLREGLGLTLIGIALGLAVAASTTRLLERLLYGVKPVDGFTFAGVSGLLVVVATFACSLPLRRALRVEAAVALRHE